MIRRIGALALKELVEHALVLLFVFVLLALGWLLFLAAAFGSPTTVTYLEAHGNFTRFALPMAAMALGNRLVVSELSGRTQRFLESLPMRPGEPLVVKWFFGAAVLLGFGLTSLAANALVASLREPMDALFLVLLATRTVVGLGTLWSFFFAMGLFGKLRVFLYLLIGLGLVVITSTTSVEFMHFGPFGLLGQDLALERRAIPWTELLECLGVSAFFLVAGGVVASVREGSVEERLSKPMSQREIAFGAIATFALMVIWGELTPEPQPAPYAMASDHVLHSNRLPIAIGYVSDDATPDALALMARLEDDVGSLAEAAGWSRLPQLRVVLRRSLDGRTFEPVGLGRDDGVLLRANFLSSAHPDLDGLSAAVIGGMLDQRTRGRSRLEPRSWIRDGIALFWATRDEGLAPERIAQAIVTTRERGPDATRMRRYFRLREAVGASAAASLAATGFGAIDASPAHGRPQIVALVQRAFPSGASDDLRAVFAEWMHPPAAQIAEATGLSEPSLLALWQAHLTVLRRDRAASALIRDLGDPRATLTVENEGAPTLVVRAEIGSGRVLTVRHVEIGPFDQPLLDHELTSESSIADASGHAEVRIAGRYGHGARVLVVADLEGSPLVAPVRLHVERLELP